MLQYNIIHIICKTYIVYNELYYIYIYIYVLYIICVSIYIAFIIYIYMRVFLSRTWPNISKLEHTVLILRPSMFIAAVVKRLVPASLNA